MKKITAKQYALALADLTRDIERPDLSKIIGNFLKLLVKNNDLRLVDKIIQEFVNYRYEQAGTIKLEVRSARKLEAELVEKIKERFKKIKKVSAVELNEIVDQSLVGGLAIKLNDLLVEASVKMNLARLKMSLKK